MVSSQNYHHYSNHNDSEARSEKFNQYSASMDNNTTYYYRNNNNYPETMDSTTGEKKQFSSGFTNTGSRNQHLTQRDNARSKESTISKITSLLMLLTLIGILGYTYKMKSEIKYTLTQVQYSHNRIRKLQSDFKRKNSELHKEKQLIIDLKKDLDILKQATKVGVAGLANGSSNIVDVLELIMDKHDDQAKEKQMLEKHLQEMYRVDLEKR